MRKFHVLHSIGKLTYGGMEQGVVKLLQGLDRERFVPHLIALRGADPALLGMLPSDVRFVALDKKPGRDWKVVVTLARYFRQHDIALVHSHNWETWLYSFLAARLAGVTAFIHGEHGRDTESLDDTLVRYWCKRFLAWRTSQLTTVSTDIARILENYLRVGNSKITTIPNGVDLLRFRPVEQRELIREKLCLPQHAFLLGTVIGCLRPVKDVISLLQAVKLLVQEIPQVVLVIVGGTEFLRLGTTSAQQYEREIQDLICTLELKQNVYFTGPISNVESYLPTFDVYVNSSVYEGMSNAILDAMACGVPIVATKVGGTPYIVQDEETGLLVEPKSARLMAGAIRALHDSIELRNRLGQNARKSIESHHNQQNMIGAYERLYTRTLEQLIS